MGGACGCRRSSVAGSSSGSVDVHALMFGIGPEILTSNSGDVRARHLEYGRQAGRLTMVVSSFRREGLAAEHLSDHLLVIPTNSRSRAGYLRDAWRIGSQICAREQVDIIVTQDPFATALVGMGLKKQFGIPIVVGNHSQFLDNQEWIAERPVRNRLFNLLAHRL